jgi:hypothetical protein
MNARLKKGKGKKGKQSPYQSRCLCLDLLIDTIVGMNPVMSQQRQKGRKPANGEKMAHMKPRAMIFSISVPHLNQLGHRPQRTLTSLLAQRSIANLMMMMMTTIMIQPGQNQIVDGGYSVILLVAKSLRRTTLKIH